MGKVIGKIVIFALPIFFVVFSLIYAYNGFQGDFAPSYADVMSKMSSFPDLALQWRTIRIIDNTHLIDGALSPMVYLGLILSMPVQIVFWFFSIIFA